MVRVLAIDPGLEDTGWSIIEKTDDNKIILLSFGLIKTNNSTPLSKRLKEIYNTINEIINKNRITRAAIEEVYFINKIKTQLLTTQARGVILLALENNNIPYSEYNPRIIKKMITGNGNATKLEIQGFIKRMFSIKKNLYPDISDSIAIGITDIRLFDLKRKGIVV